jgi:hypothetical protein
MIITMKSINFAALLPAGGTIPQSGSGGISQGTGKEFLN